MVTLHSGLHRLFGASLVVLAVSFLAFIFCVLPLQFIVGYTASITYGAVAIKWVLGSMFTTLLLGLATE